MISDIRKGFKMIETELSHCEVVAGSIAGEQAVDEQTFASVAILAERLERVQKLGKQYSGITFSCAVEELAKQVNAVAVS